MDTYFEIEYVSNNGYYASFELKTDAPVNHAIALIEHYENDSLKWNDKRIAFQCYVQLPNGTRLTVGKDSVYLYSSRSTISIKQAIKQYDVKVAA